MEYDNEIMGSEWSAIRDAIAAAKKKYLSSCEGLSDEGAYGFLEYDVRQIMEEVFTGSEK